MALSRFPSRTSPPSVSRRYLGGILVLVAFGWWTQQAAPDTVPAPGSPSADDGSNAFGIHVTQGAAAGYVDDRLCGRCHSEIARSYQEVAMSKSFYRPRQATAVEDFDSSFEHPTSQRIYQMRREGDRYLFRRHQVDAKGREINVVEIEVDWILGSGNHARTYLYQNPQGELYQLPLAWYAADGLGRPPRWGITPGFDDFSNPGVRRIVQRECMFCHNAYPEVAQGSDQNGMPHFFPEELPEGIGCQRCHGPGGEHVRLALGGDSWDLPTVDDEGHEISPTRATIVNPGRFPPERRHDVCLSCHLQPTVSIPGMRRFGRSDYSYRVGEPLHEFFVNVDVEEKDRRRDERFEINHHPYRLQQSRCYTESAGALGCLSCHDPHRKVAEEDRAAHYRAVCSSCHEVDACQLQNMGAEALAADDHLSTVDPQDCVTCHMPRRRPTDVVQVVMTDHTIQKRVDFEALVAPLAESTPVIVDIALVGEDRPDGSLGEVYRAVAVERSGGQIESLEHLQRHLPKAQVEHLEPWHQLARGLVGSRQFKEAKDLTVDLGQRFGDDPRVLNLQAIAHLGLGEPGAAVDSLRKAKEVRPDRPEGSFNLARLLLSQGKTEEALAHFEIAISQRPLFDRAWLLQGQAQRRLGRLEEAMASYRRALAIVPTNGRAYGALVDLLVSMGRHDEAQRWWRHGRTHALDPTALPKKLPPPPEADPLSP